MVRSYFNNFVSRIYVSGRTLNKTVTPTVQINKTYFYKKSVKCKILNSKGFAYSNNLFMLVSPAKMDLAIWDIWGLADQILMLLQILR